ncbi:TetR/AcrR family transcriptional regulator [Tistrella bauzanensis]|uniref:TetR/AcrR family transcriptional regulator n=1 Tax=Tistrella TaxID=171436 RepID=UPI0031F67C72
MARPREFDEAAVLDAAIQCFWAHGYEATSIRDLTAGMGITGASLYNAFGDKRALYHRALDRYVEETFGDRVRRLQGLPPRQAIAGFFAEVIDRSVGDPQQRGCMAINAALEATPRDPGFRDAVAGVLMRMEAFFLDCVTRGQRDGTITTRLPAEDLARHFLGLLLGIRVLARTRPDRALLEAVLRPALFLLDTASPGDTASGGETGSSPAKEGPVR